MPATMLSPVRSTVKQQIIKARAALNTYESEIATLAAELPQVSSNASPGELFALIARHQGSRVPVDFQSTVKRVSQLRKRAAAKMNKAQDEITQARAVTGQWVDVARYLKGEIEYLPAGMDTHVRQAAIVARRGARAGVIDGKSLAAECERNALQALEFAGRELDRLAGIVSALGVASAAKSGMLYEKCEAADWFSDKDRERFARLVVHNKRVEDERKQRHREHFTPYKYRSKSAKKRARETENA